MRNAKKLKKDKGNKMARGDLMTEVPGITPSVRSECAQCPIQKENRGDQLPFVFNLADFYVDIDVAKAKTLPFTAYTDKEFQKFMLRSSLFRNTWRLVPERLAHLDDSSFVLDAVNIRRAYYSFHLDQDPLLLVRDDQGNLRCLSNVCTHAWGLIKPQEGAGKLEQLTKEEPNLICPYHRAQFSLDGTYKGHQRGLAESGMAPENYPGNLAFFDVEEWKKFLFVSLGKPVAPFKTAFAEIDESVQYLPFNQIKIRSQASELRDVPGSPILHGQNYQDGPGHGPSVHPGETGLVGAIEMKSYKVERYAYSSLSWAYAQNPELGFAPDQLPVRFSDPHHPEKRVFALWWYVLPNLTLNFYPWGLSVNVYRPVLEKPNKTDFEWYHYPWDMQKYEQRERWLNNQVHNEDVQIISQVAKGIGSEHVKYGKLVPGIDDGVHWLLRRHYELIFSQPIHDFNAV